MTAKNEHAAALARLSRATLTDKQKAASRRNVLKGGRKHKPKARLYLSTAVYWRAVDETGRMIPGVEAGMKVEAERLAREAGFTPIRAAELDLL